MSTPTTHRSIAHITEAIAGGSLSALELTNAHLERIGNRSELNTFVHVMTDDARRTAGAVDSGTTTGALAGVPIAIKDNICIKDHPCTCASRILKDWIAPYDATVIERLRDAGAVLIGKTNLDEFAMGSSNEHSFFGPARNPHDPTRTTGGSSGGSAAAVADGQCVAALGSDTGGSVRLPASFCGVVGLKPTYGAVSRWGLVAFASSLDQIGVFARSIDDARCVYDVIHGYDPRDSTSMHLPPPPKSSNVIRIGIPRDDIADVMSPDVEEAVDKTIDHLQSTGAQVSDIKLPHLSYSLAAYYIICTAEASSNLARYDGVRYGHRSNEASELDAMFEHTRAEGFGDEVKRRILLGTYVLSAGYYDAYYGRAQQARRRIAGDFDACFEEVDCVLMPTATSCAFRLGEKMDDPLAMYMIDAMTTAVNLAGLPAISVPCGSNPDGLPIGVQLIGPPFAEHRLLDIGRHVEEMVNSHAP